MAFTAILIWAIVVAFDGTIIGAIPWETSFDECERTTLVSTFQGQQQRAAAGLPPNGAHAYCVYALTQPVVGDPAPRPGVQL